MKFGDMLTSAIDAGFFSDGGFFLGFRLSSSASHKAIRSLTACLEARSRTLLTSSVVHLAIWSGVKLGIFI
jgi:hypothetical protein